jgi:hypothetical protein
MFDPKPAALPASRFRPVTWFLNNARWYGVEWWITLFGGALLTVIILMTVFADRFAPYDPIKFVGAPFTRPGAQQSVIVLAENDAIGGVQDLRNVQVGVVTNSQAIRELGALEIAYREYDAIRLAVGALAEGQIKPSSRIRGIPNTRGKCASRAFRSR